MDHFCMKTPLGVMTISGDQNGISAMAFDTDKELSSRPVPASLTEAVGQIEEYFADKRERFDLPLNPAGTAFQKKVWKELGNIGYGKTISYRELATALGDPKVIRAAASANSKNPIAIVIPCHRVIGSDGSMTGYAGGIHRKQWLLEHENNLKQTSLF